MKMKLYSFLLLLAVVCTAQAQTASTGYLLNANMFERQIGNTKGQLIDVRTAEEFGKGHIDQAKNIDVTKDDFEANIAQLDKDTPVYVYCKSGGRSAKAVEKLRRQGFTKVYELDGGYNAWEKRRSPHNSK